ncbi:hypothetical protein ENSA5_18630 [Enhygromyxa salina]|uniref:Secreted protein n=1 Tax=Enhygromyxa salina TaxID=215803 RepID=A0A2S9YCT3_9BACT|nr:hypothetical protein [Enhygromyxa salina]PRQ02924.1 hypothetical protein ENSA5_18630 [Enhygromyxa salina]
MSTPAPLRSRLGLATLLGVLACLGASACDQRSGGGTVAPGGDGIDSELQPEGEFEGESIDELSLRLDRLVEQQDQKVSASDKDPAKCEELCELSRAICEVKAKMCEIADERVADDEYQDLCRVAKQRCEQASRSCVRCVRHHQRTGQSGGIKSGGREPEPASCEGQPASVED